MRGQIGPARAEGASVARQHQLRADAVRRGGEEPPLVQRMEAREGTEPACARRLDRRPQALDDVLGPGERHARALVRRRQDAQSTTVPRQETPTDHLRALARRIGDVVVDDVAPRSVLLTGSAATGEADFYSDVDLIIYCDELPTEERIGAVVERVGGVDRKLIYPRTEDEHGESFELGGIQCQLAFVTVRCADGELERVLAGEELESPLQKAVEGILDGTPLHGPELIRSWRARAADYPDSLRRAMIER
ncbi:MAG: hypothetical protein E6G22_08865, partial [Actinobacteria bacterium]